MSLDPDESVHGFGQGGREVSLITNECEIRVPNGVDLPHPDALALAAVTIAIPWIRGRVRFDTAISSRMAETLAECFQLSAGPVDPTLSPRSGGQVGLAYSGGADSIATGRLLSSSTPFVHFKRISHPRVPNRATHMRADVAAALVELAAARNRSVHIVESDLEFVVAPFPMFPEWTTVALPVIVMSDHLGLGGTAFGTIMGSRYLSNGYRYRAPPVKDRWAEVFEAAGLPFVRPACGLTEVSTIRIAAESDLADLVRSCALGPMDGPCLNCKKCLRKELTTAGIEERELDPALLRNMTESHPAVKEFLEPPPYYFQHVVEFGLARAVGLESTFLAHAKAVLNPDHSSTDWTTRFYPPAIQNDVPESLRNPVEKAVSEVAQLMTQREINLVESWDAATRGA